jgi:hypothetical protein
MIKIVFKNKENDSSEYDCEIVMFMSPLIRNIFNDCPDIKELEIPPEYNHQEFDVLYRQVADVLNMKTHVLGFDYPEHSLKDYLLCEIPCGDLSGDVCEYFIINGNSYEMCALIKNGHSKEQICDLAAASGQLDCLIAAHSLGCQWDENTMLCAVFHNRSGILRHLLDNECSITPWVCPIMCYYGNTEMLIYAHQRKCPLSFDVNHDSIVKTEHVECECIGSNGVEHHYEKEILFDKIMLCSEMSRTLYNLVKSKTIQADVLPVQRKSLHKIRSAVYSGKNFECLRYVHQHGEKLRKLCMYEAIKSYNLEMMEYLFEAKCPIDPEKCYNSFFDTRTDRKQQQQQEFVVFEHFHQKCPLNDKVSWERVIGLSAQHDNQLILKFLYDKEFQTDIIQLMFTTIWNGTGNFILLHKLTGILKNEHIFHAFSFGSEETVKYMLNNCDYDTLKLSDLFHEACNCNSRVTILMMDKYNHITDAIIRERLPNHLLSFFEDLVVVRNILCDISRNLFDWSSGRWRYETHQRTLNKLSEIIDGSYWMPLLYHHYKLTRLFIDVDNLYKEQQILISSNHISSTNRYIRTV